LIDIFQVCGCAISSDNNFIASASSDHTVKVWDTNNGECKLTNIGHTSPVTGCDISKNNKFIVSSSDDMSVRVWDMNGKCIKIFEGHKSTVNACVFTPDLKFVISASSDETVRIWNFESGNCLNILDGHSAEVFCIATSHNTAGRRESEYKFILEHQIITLKQQIVNLKQQNVTHAQHIVTLARFAINNLIS